MAVITFNDITGGVDMSLIQTSGFLDYDFSQRSATELKLYDNASNYSLFTGTGFAYTVQSGQVKAITAGTLTGLKVVSDNVAAVSVTGLNVSAKAVGDSIFNGQDAVFLSLLLAGNDTVNGTKFADLLMGGGGNDTLIGGLGADKLLGGAGTDIASYVNATAGVIASLVSPAGNSGEAKGDTYSSIEGLSGSKFVDKLVGDGNGNVLYGLAGNDNLDGGAGNDVLIGGLGADTLIGGAGTDTASYADAAKGVVANLAKPSLNTNDALGDTFSSIENLTGSRFGDTLTGNAGVNVLLGGDGADVLNGAAGNDRLDGGAGDDVLIGGLGADTLIGGAGIDTASYADAAKGVIANLANSKVNTNDALGDTFSFIENLTGSNYADTLTGDANANMLVGGAGADVLNGAAGNDTLYGGAGADDLYGGGGKDVFVFKATSESTVSTANRDTIFDFTADDKINLSAIDANSKTSTNDPFSFIDTKGFSGKGGELRYEKQASDTYIYGDINGDKVADFVIHLDDAVILKSGYFVL
ncbi:MULTISPECIES: calcium-binding protein [unclassified Rhizobium]|uniref:calcium-binding protein n=1 Tax=unclassified Rhizobium TaxID=2613769 RepID=UPI0006F9DCAC|nr:MULTISPECIES: calcium-binding protein [unclassified Rhizobium]KQV43355.1 hypothetical protein ASC86_00605 [Rhizobium sp. Root1212]KRD37540.1 hypothetical protein ASE37_00605 [Rhizobium sp. Root268]